MTVEIKRVEALSLSSMRNVPGETLPETN
jgi:hypothetical protein